jgi:hypothetical protein
MRLAKTTHIERPWRIHELTRDFVLEDVWALPTPGGPGHFPELVAMMASGNPLHSASGPVRFLAALRERMGARAGWDDDATGLGARVSSLRDRLPLDLRETDPPVFDELPFVSLYVLDDEFAAEAANSTMHGVLHLGWVQEPGGGYRGQMAVLVKPNGWLGKVYMAAIKPFRHLIVYPALMRFWERGWQRRMSRRANESEAHDMETTH